MTIISTHSPARGLTGCNVLWVDADNISTHSPARGLTKYNFTQKVVIGHISTHSPARGLTGFAMCCDFADLFQLTAPQGG